MPDSSELLSEVRIQTQLQLSVERLSRAEINSDFSDLSRRLHDLRLTDDELDASEIALKWIKQAKILSQLELRIKKPFKALVTQTPNFAPEHFRNLNDSLQKYMDELETEQRWLARRWWWPSRGHSLQTVKTLNVISCCKDAFSEIAAQLAVPVHTEKDARTSLLEILAEMRSNKHSAIMILDAAGRLADALDQSAETLLKEWVQILDVVVRKREQQFRKLFQSPYLRARMLFVRTAVLSHDCQEQSSEDTKNVLSIVVQPFAPDGNGIKFVRGQFGTRMVNGAYLGPDASKSIIPNQTPDRETVSLMLNRNGHQSAHSKSTSAVDEKQPIIDDPDTDSIEDPAANDQVLRAATEAEAIKVE